MKKIDRRRLRQAEAATAAAWARYERAGDQGEALEAAGQVQLARAAYTGVLFELSRPGRGAWKRGRPGTKGQEAE